MFKASILSMGGYYSILVLGVAAQGLGFGHSVRGVGFGRLAATVVLLLLPLHRCSSCAFVGKICLTVVPRSSKIPQLRTLP